MKDGCPFLFDLDSRMDIAVRAGELPCVSKVGYCLEGLLVNGTFAAPQVMAYLRESSADVNGFADDTFAASKRLPTTLVRDGCLFSFKLSTLAVDIFGGLFICESAEELVQTLVLHAVGGWTRCSSSRGCNLLSLVKAYNRTNVVVRVDNT